MKLYNVIKALTALMMALWLVSAIVLYSIHKDIREYENRRIEMYREVYFEHIQD